MLIHAAVHLKNQRFFCCTGIRPIIQQKCNRLCASTSLLYFCWIHCSLFHTLYHNLIFTTTKEATFAASFEKQGFSYVIKEEELTSEKLLAAITSVDENKETYKQAMSQSNQQDAVVKVADIIEKACK